MADFGMNLRVTMDSKQGGRKYMEDVLAVTFKKTDDGRNIEFTYLAVFDGHGGEEAAKFAKEHLLDEVTKHKGFWGDDDSEVERAIREGFLSTHRLMWKAVGSWPKTLSGYPSTAGTTASVCFIRNGKLYIAHVGDSTVVLGTKNDEDEDRAIAECVTEDHKPECPNEIKRIQSCGGNVMPKAGVPRVVWNRPKLQQGCVRRSTNVDTIPFLAIARALGDLWSYNPASDKFVVSPDPDITTRVVDLKKHKFIILASDGLWNMVSFQEAVNIVHELNPQAKHPVHGRKPASHLVNVALERWSKRMLRADNTSVIVAYFDPPGMHSQEYLLRAPSDASTLKMSDSEDSLSDSESDNRMPRDDDIGEDSHQVLGEFMTPPPSVVNKLKPGLKRLTNGSRHVVPKSAPAKVIFTENKVRCGLGVSKKSEPLFYPDNCTNSAVMESDDFDPDKASIISVQFYGPNPPERLPNISCLSAKRPRLATPESSQVENSPMPETTPIGRNRKHSGHNLPSSSTCSPLKLEVKDTTNVKKLDPMISPLWPSHLADDLDDEDSPTLVRPTCSSTDGDIRKDVLQENSSSGKISTAPLPKVKVTVKRSRSFTQGSQNRSPITRACVKRLSGTSRYKIRQKSSLNTKIHTVHRTRVSKRSFTPKQS